MGIATGPGSKSSYSMKFTRFNSDMVQAGKRYLIDRHNLYAPQKCVVLKITSSDKINGGYMIHCLVDGNRESFIMAQAMDVEWKEVGGVGKGIALDVRAVRSSSKKPGVLLDSSEEGEIEDLSEMQGRAAS